MKQFQFKHLRSMHVWSDCSDYPLHDLHRYVNLKKGKLDKKIRSINRKVFKFDY